jgi:hypothetical protein
LPKNIKNKAASKTLKKNISQEKRVHYTEEFNSGVRLKNIGKMHSTLLLQKFGCKNFTKLQLNPD